MPNLDARPLLYDPRLRISGGVQLTRTGEPTVNNYGETVDGTSTVITLDPVVIHNAGGRDLLQLPEASRVIEHIKGFTEQRVYAGDSGSVKPDEVTWRGRTWVVDHVEDYDVQGGVYIWMAALKEVGS